MQKASKDIQLFIFIFYEYNSSGISNINALGLYDSMRTVTQLCFLINVSCLFNATVHGSVGKWSPLKPKTRRLWAKTPASPSCQRVWESHPSPAGSLAPCSMQYVCVCVLCLLAWCKVHLKSAYDLVSTLPGDIQDTHTQWCQEQDVIAGVPACHVSRCVYLKRWMQEGQFPLWVQFHRWWKLWDDVFSSLFGSTEHATRGHLSSPTDPLLTCSPRSSSAGDFYTSYDK